MNKGRESKGITLISLIITIVVLVILASISIKSGTESLDNTRLQGFYTQLEIIQKRVDDIAVTNETYISNGETIYLKNAFFFITFSFIYSIFQLFNFIQD